ncbi:outer envelope pore protein 16-4 [Quercus suber]|uniref:Outer envelope pore protein 16-4 n=1 Tax=Quercus suber TaxID=58331 RepID=A0AAW0LJW2_QUESU
MEDEINGAVPCSSLAVDSILRVGTAGAIWGLCMGPYDARKQGLSGVTRASFVAKAVGKFGFQYGLVAGIYMITRCGIQRYRRQKIGPMREEVICQEPYNFKLLHAAIQSFQYECGVNGLVAGALAGAAFAARTRSWTQVIGMAGLVSVFSAAADYSRTS